MTAPLPAVTDAELTAAMRTFERFSTVLRYREAEKWHVNDIQGMRAAIQAVLALRAGSGSARLDRSSVKVPPARPGPRHDLDRMAEAIHALPGGPTMGRAIGSGR